MAFLGGLAPNFSEAQQSKFFDTTDGNPKTDTKGGIMPEDEAKISAETQKLLERFRNGRYSSNKDGKSRYSGILEMHDEDFDGITDHDNPGNSLEGGMDEAAIGKRGGSGEKRQKALYEEWKKAGDCKDGFVNGNKKFPCKNISAVLVDRGAAHGHGGDKDAEEAHRVLELTKKAYDKAKQAGAEYGDSAVNAAADYVGAPPTGAQAVKDKNGLVTSMNVESGGKITNVKVGANVDLLKSEYAWLERQKQRQIDLEWQSLRAARLAGAETDQTATRIFADIFGNNSITDPATKQREAATRVYEWSEMSDLKVCEKLGKFLKTDNGGNPTCKDDEASGGPVVTLSEFLAKKQDPSLAQKMWEEGRKLTGQNQGSQSEKKDRATEIAKIERCLGRDVWCYDLKHAKAVARQDKSGKSDPYKMRWTQASGDPGAVFDDVREAIFNRLSAANAGGVDDFDKVMKTIDFNAGTDAKAKTTKPYKEMMDQLQKIRAAAKLVQTGQGDTERTDDGKLVRQNGIQASSSNPYANQKNFNTKTMNTLQLFGRNPARDGGAIANIPMPVGPQPIAGASGSGGSPPSKNYPAPPPSNYGNGFNDRLNTGY